MIVRRPTQIRIAHGYRIITRLFMGTNLTNYRAIFEYAFPYDPEKKFRIQFKTWKDLSNIWIGYMAGFYVSSFFHPYILLWKWFSSFCCIEEKSTRLVIKKENILRINWLISGNNWRKDKYAVYVLFLLKSCSITHKCDGFFFVKDRCKYLPIKKHYFVFRSNNISRNSRTWQKLCFLKFKSDLLLIIGQI